MRVHKEKKRRLKIGRKRRSLFPSAPRLDALSVDFLHLRGLLVRALNLLERRKVVVTRIVVVVDAQAELDHAVDASRELRRLVQREARSEQRRVEQEPDEVLH